VRLLDGDVAGRRIGVLGAAFKADSDDVRESPALDIAARLRGHGAQVRLYDPRATGNARRAQPDLQTVGSVEQACAGAELVLVLTDWDEFRGLDPVALAGVVQRPTVLDGRLVLDPDKWRAAGWDVHALGRGAR
jgi:UDPglucose 6-dehydrogenase